MLLRGLTEESYYIYLKSDDNKLDRFDSSKTPFIASHHYLHKCNMAFFQNVTVTIRIKFQFPCVSKFTFLARFTELKNAIISPNTINAPGAMAISDVPKFSEKT